MIKYILLLILLVTNISNAQTTTCVPTGFGVGGEMDLIDLEGSSTVAEEEWLNQYFISGNSHPDAQNYYTESRHGTDDCGFGISFNLDTVLGDYAYYSKIHSDQNEIRFRFVLDTENLLNSFIDDDELLLYKFEATDPNYPFANESMLEVKLKRLSKNRFNQNVEWKLLFKWFDNDLETYINQAAIFHTDDSFVEFEYFWKKFMGVEQSSGAVGLLYSDIKSGVMVTVGVEGRPRILLSPYSQAYRHAVLEGVSSLGYIDSNNTLTKVGDEMRIVSPRKYNN